MNLVPFPSMRTNETKDYYFTRIVNSSTLRSNTIQKRDMAFWGSSGYVLGGSSDENAKLTTGLVGSIFVRYSNNQNVFGVNMPNNVMNSLYTMLGENVDPLPIGINGISHVCMARNFIRFAQLESTSLKYIRMFIQSLQYHPISDASSHTLSFPLKYVPVTESSLTIVNSSFVDLRSPFTNTSQGFSRGQPRYKGRIVIDLIDKHDEGIRKEIELFFSRIRSQENFFIVPLFRTGESRESDSLVNLDPSIGVFLDDGHIPFNTNVVAVDSTLRVDGSQEITLALNHRFFLGGEISYRPNQAVTPETILLAINGFTLQPGNFVNINGRLAQIIDRVSSGIVINNQIPILPESQAYPKNNSFLSNYVYWREPFVIAKLDKPNYSNPYKAEFKGPWVIDWVEAL